VRQPNGYRAFLPAPLPPNPSVQLAGELHAALSRADRALGRLDGSVVTLPNPDLLVFMYVRKEAVLSSQIEGTQSSLQDLLAAEANLFEPSDLPRDVDEVINYVSAMNHGLARLAELPVSVRLIKEIHERPTPATSPSPPRPRTKRSRSSATPIHRRMARSSIGRSIPTR
jgi:Fic family protein